MSDGNAPADPSAADRLAIMELVARYNWAIDTRDAAAYADTFTPDGVFDGGTELLTGRTELMDFVGLMARSPGAQGLQHWTSNFVFLEAGPDRAVVRSYMMGPKDSGGTCSVGVVGRYVDTLAKVDGRWLFTHREWREWHEAEGSTQSGADAS